MADIQAWLQLSEIFAAQMNFQKAAFCFDELARYDVDNNYND